MNLNSPLTSYKLFGLWVMGRIHNNKGMVVDTSQWSGGRSHYSRKSLAKRAAIY